MHAKFASLAAARRAEIAAGDAKRAGLEAERAVLKRKEMKALWEKQKAREAKYAEMMSAENDAGLRRWWRRRARTAARRMRRARRTANDAPRRRRKSARRTGRRPGRTRRRWRRWRRGRKKSRKTIKKELRMRAAALEAEAKKRREASEEARRAERRARGEVTPKKKKKRRPRGRRELASGSGAKRAGSNAVGDENVAPSPNVCPCSGFEAMNDEVRDDVRAYQTSDAITMHTYDDVSRKELVLVLYSSASSSSSRKNVFTKTLEKTSRQTPCSAASLTRRARAPPSFVPLRRRHSRRPV